MSASRLSAAPGHSAELPPRPLFGKQVPAPTNPHHPPARPGRLKWPSRVGEPGFRRSELMEAAGSLAAGRGRVTGGVDEDRGTEAG